MKTVLASGVFDGIHKGHLHYLKQAKQFGDKLIVVVTSDKTALKQGKKPLLSQDKRVKLLSSLAIVDKAVIGQPGAKLKSVKDISPDIIALGYDQFPDLDSLRRELRSLNWHGQLVRIIKKL